MTLTKIALTIAAACFCGSNLSAQTTITLGDSPGYPNSGVRQVTATSPTTQPFGPTTTNCANGQCAVPSGCASGCCAPSGCASPGYLGGSGCATNGGCAGGGFGNIPSIGCADSGCASGGGLFGGLFSGLGGGCADSGCAAMGGGCADACGSTGSGITFGGWISGGFTDYNNNQFNNRPDRLNLNQAWFYLEKVADGSCGLDWGFRVDYVYGTDGQDTQAFGNPPNSWDIDWDHGGFYGQAIPQLYAEVASGDISVKVGHFFTLIGYESVPAPQNFFYSHSFSMFNAEPFTHTGAVATANMGAVELYGGYVFGWDTGFDEFGGASFLGGISADLNDNFTITYIGMAGDVGFGTDFNGYNHSIVAEIGLTDRLSYVLQNDYVNYQGTGAYPAGRFNESYSVNNYLFYQYSKNIGLGVRGEWWSPTLPSGARVDLYNATVGANIRLLKNVVIRPEARYDVDNAGVLIPAADNEQFGFGVDAIITFGG